MHSAAQDAVIYYYYVGKSKNTLIPFGIRKNCLSSGRSLLLY
jgi:hypothetical protein